MDLSKDTYIRTYADLVDIVYYRVHFNNDPNIIGLKKYIHNKTMFYKLQIMFGGDVTQEQVKMIHSPVY